MLLLSPTGVSGLTTVDLNKNLEDQNNYGSKFTEILENMDVFNSNNDENDKNNDGSDREKYALSIGQVFRTENNHDIPSKSSLDQEIF